MRYQRVAWLHDFLTEPVLLYAEIDREGWERRKVDRFRDGRLAWADEDHDSPDTGTFLSVEPMPDLNEINADREFDGVEISSAEFEAVWVEALARSPARDTAEH